MMQPSVQTDDDVLMMMIYSLSILFFDPFQGINEGPWLFLSTCIFALWEEQQINSARAKNEKMSPPDD